MHPTQLLDEVLYEVLPTGALRHPATQALYCSECHAITHTPGQYPYNHRPSSRQGLCEDCHAAAEARALAENATPCLFCRKPADRRWEPHVYDDDGQPAGSIHGLCRAKLYRTAESHAIERQVWRQVTWRTCTLYWLLTCGHSFEARRPNQKTLRCPLCAEARLLTRRPLRNLEAPK